MYEDPASQLFKRVVVDDLVCCFIEFWFCNDDLVGRRLDDFLCDGAKVDCSRKLGEVFKRIRIVNSTAPAVPAAPAAPAPRTAATSP